MSEDTTQYGTPDHSDEDDAGDYEHVLGVLTPGTASPHRSRSGSYADLQKIRLSKPSARGKGAGPTLIMPLTTSTPGDSPGAVKTASPENSPTSSPRTRHRRGSTLEDSVPVDRLAGVPRRASFDEATQLLNREINDGKR
jgi:glycerol-3-phosphate O-acyltransferase / dihydroxyacetone phosphate acyltransferase